jgi:transaldolase
MRAVRFDTLAPNMQVEIPATHALDEVTVRGAKINATVPFTVAQAVVDAEAVAQALNCRAEAGW